MPGMEDATDATWETSMESLEALWENSTGLPDNVTGVDAQVGPVRVRTEPWVEVVRQVCVWTSLPIAVLGILGNLLSFVVLCRHKHKSTTRVLLQALAITDSLFLLFTLLLLSFRYAVDGYAGSLAYIYLHRWLYPSVYVLRLAGTWLTVLLTVDRFIAVCHPLHAQRLCTLRRTYFLMALMLAVTLLLCLPRFLECEIYEKNGTQAFRETALVKMQSYTVGYRILLYLLIMYLTPMVLMILLNSWLLRALRRATSHMLHEPALFTKSFGSGGGEGGKCTVARGSADSMLPQSFMHPQHLHARAINRSVTVIVIIVVLVSIACNVTAMVAHVLWSLKTGFAHLAYLDTARRPIANFSNLFVTLNSAINFVIYCLCSRNFRAVCVRTFGIDQLMSRLRERRARSEGARRMTQSSTAASYISLLRMTSHSQQNKTGNKDVAACCRCAADLTKK